MSFPTLKQTKLKLLQLLIGVIQAMVLGCIFLLGYAIFGDSFDFSTATTNQQFTTIPTNRNTDSDDWDKVENGIHLGTGLAYAKNFDIVRANCTACHSGKLIAQNRATRAGWQQMIRWMQKTQGLWDLGTNETKILDYLETYYAPQKVGRRANLDVAAIEWYILELNNTSEEETLSQ